jgi:putative molybdopterin biosynthesis protein
MCIRDRNMPDSTSYTPEEVAKILKVSKFTVYELIKRGELIGYKVGRKVRVDGSDLDIYVKQAKQIGQSPVRAAHSRAENFFSSDEGLIICGQDAILDVLTRHLEKQMPNVQFLRKYVGSMAGLLALYHGTANVVTAHLWDSDNDDYNLPYVRRILPGYSVMIFNLIYRMEGFYVAKGNPKNIKDWSDLTRTDVVFVNRERGAGARVLLDEKINKLKIDRHAINGYDHEEMSHLAVASCVARGEADAGIGTEKAATQVSEIEFIPMHKERYDLAIKREDFNKPHFQELLSVVRSDSFRNEVSGMGGYDISKMGELIAET